MLLSRTCEYAVRALAALADLPAGTWGQVPELARVATAPVPTTAKALQRLARHGVVESYRGPTGGFRLARSAKAISLYDIVAAVDGIQGLSRCAVGLAECSDSAPCPLHDQYKPVRERLRRYLEKTSLADMARAVRRKQALMKQRTKTRR